MLLYFQAFYNEHYIYDYMDYREYIIIIIVLLHLKWLSKYMFYRKGPHWK